MHDPRIGRFFAVDPLAAQYPYNSPYNFSENVVINSVELEGLELANAWCKLEKLVQGAQGLEMNNANSLIGQVQQQNYELMIVNPKIHFSKLYEKMTTNINSIYGTVNGKFSFEKQQNEDEITKNDILQIDPSNALLFDMYVKVTNIENIEGDTERVPEAKVDGFKLTFRTLDGHAENGVINFEVLRYKLGENVFFEFNIYSESQINVDFAKMFMSAYSRDKQRETWESVMQNIANFMGGTVQSANGVSYSYDATDWECKDNNGTDLGSPKKGVESEKKVLTVSVKSKKKK